MFENLGPTELIVILVIVIVLFGAKRVPEIGASIGKGIREFKRGMSDLGDEAGVTSAADLPRSEVRSPRPDTPDAAPKRLMGDATGQTPPTPSSDAA